MFKFGPGLSSFPDLSQAFASVCLTGCGAICQYCHSTIPSDSLEPLLFILELVLTLWLMYVSLLTVRNTTKSYI